MPELNIEDNIKAYRLRWDLYLESRRERVDNYEEIRKGHWIHSS